MAYPRTRITMESRSHTLTPDSDGFSRRLDALLREARSKATPDRLPGSSGPERSEAADPFRERLAAQIAALHSRDHSVKPNGLQDATCQSGGASVHAVRSGQPLAAGAPTPVRASDDDLAVVNRAWPSLPAHVRSAIVTLARANMENANAPTADYNSAGR